MRKFSLILFPLLLILLVAVLFIYVKRPALLRPTYLIPTPTQISEKPHIIFPQATDTLMKGKVYTLQWTAGSGKTDIFLVNKALESAGVSVSLDDRVYHVDNTGSYSYTVSATLPDGMYKFEIGNLTSEYFPIVRSTTTTSYCFPQNLQATLSLSPGAGNVYGTLQLTNSSHVTCSVIGNNFITPTYSTTVKNITVEHERQPVQEIFSLAPGQSLYSQLHYPNGPQCNSPIKTTPVTFRYVLSPSSTITFSDADGNKTQQVTTCQALTDSTTIQIWAMAKKPITPNQ